LRRPLTVAAITLILFGIEVATGALSVAAVRLWSGLIASLTGNEFVVSRPRYLTGVLLALSGGVLYGVMLWADRAQGEIRTGGPVCPNCGTRTKRVRRRKRHRILSRILETSVTRRSCERCGWNGLSA
jgi:H+/Cl- antiporter ClcA